jgi:DNA-binding beta-propeller fold protein YncE
MGAGAGQGVSAYATNSSSGTLSAVKAVSGSLFAAGTEPVGAAVDPTGKFVYVANNASNNLSAYTINSSTGALTAIGGSPFAAGTGPWSIAVLPRSQVVELTKEPWSQPSL